MANNALMMGDPSLPGGPAPGLTITSIDTKFGNTANVHSLTGVPANALLVVTTGSQNSNQNCTVSSVPALTWTKRVDAQATGSPNAEIWTATFIAGGAIAVTSNWGTAVQTSVCYQLTGDDTTIGAGTVGLSQNVGNISVTTTRTNSIIIATSTNWNAPDAGPGGTLTVYRGTPTQSYYYRDVTAASFWHYYQPAVNIQAYPIGYTSPVDVDNGTSTVALEIRSLTGSGPTPDTTDPVMSTLSSPSKTHNTINLSWTAATDNVGVTGYEIYVGAALVTTVTGTSHQLTGLSASTLYSIYVRAKDAAGNGDDSNTIAVTTNAQPVDSTPPSPAPVLSSPSKTAVSINVAWTASNDNIAMAGYDIYRNGVQIDTVSVATLSYQYTSLTASTAYTLRVEARDTSGNVTASNNLIVTTNATADTTPPTSPILSSPNQDVNTIDLSWTASTDNVGVIGYDVYISPSTFFTTTTSLTQTVNGLTQNTSYSFFVRARDAAGNTGQSNTVTVSTDAAPVGGQPLTFTAQTGDYRRYWGGAEYWGGGNAAVPLIDQNGNTFTHAHRYRRFVWNDWENSPAGSYRFTENFGNGLKVFIDACIAQKQLASFGIMTCYPGFDAGNSFHTRTVFSGVGAAYPTYLHTLMQAEGQPDWNNGDCWTPNFNSPNYIARFTALMVALHAFLNTTVSGQPYTYGDCVGYIDLRGMGAYGEWHSAGIVNQDVDEYPGFSWSISGGQKVINSYGAFPTPASLISIIDAQRNNLPDWPLTTILNSMDGNFPNGGTGEFSGYYSTGFINTAIPVSVGQYIMNNGNTWGNIGRRRDQWGDTNSYYSTVSEQTNGITGIPTRWQTAPINGEPPGYTVNSGAGHMGAFPAQAITQHASIVGNSNYGGTAPHAPSMQTAFRTMGCILRPTGGTVNLTATQLIITLNWRNFGVAPQYKKNWVTTFELRNLGGSLLWSDTSSFNPFLLLPSGTSTQIVDTKTRPVVTGGNHILSIIIKDQAGYLEPLQLGITGRQTPSGQYNLATLTF